MYKRRLKILLGFIGAIFLVLLVRLGQLQLLQGDQYRQTAELGLRSYVFPQGQRGRIFDRRGVILAEDVACHDLCLDFGLLKDDADWKDRRVRAICKVRGLDRTDPDEAAHIEAEVERRIRFTWRLVENVAAARGQDPRQAVDRVVRKVQRWRAAVGGEIKQEYLPHPIVPALTEREVNSLRPLMKDTIGAVLVPSHYRFYPQGEVGCHIIGVTGPVYRAEAEAWNLSAEKAGYVERMRYNRLPGDRIGKTGVELMCESLLRPRRGVWVYRRPGQRSYQEPPRNGRDVHLTIDIALQADLTGLLRGTGGNGAIVVLDVTSGDVLAAASWPVYDLNTFRRNYNDLAGLSTRPDPNDPQRKVLTPSALRARANQPLIHRAMSGVYPPGSTVKPVVALVGLARGVLTPEMQIVCTGVNRHARNGKPRCWIYKNYSGATHGPLALVNGLKKSCNIYFVEVGAKLGSQRLAEGFGEFGFGRRPGMGLSASEESAGLMKSGPFLPSDAWFLAIGQGFAATPLQVANAHATVARDGEFLSPRLSLEGAPQQRQRRLSLSPGQMRAVQQGMHAVVHERGGTAYKHWRSSQAGPDIGVEICGKTGTATASPLKIDTDDDGRRDTLVAEGDHAWFAGFAPYRRPEIAFAVLLEYAGSGGEHAVPVAKETLRICQKHGYLPDGEGGGR